MSTLFGRRYVRKTESVGNTEKTIGVFILLLVAAIVALFVVQAVTDRTYLFNVDPALHRSGDESRDVAVARRTLPALEGTPWQTAAAAEAVALTDCNLWAANCAWSAKSGKLCADLAAFGASSTYLRKYATRDELRGGLDILVSDMLTPAQAFGLCRARRPEGAQPLLVGRDGWMAPDGLQGGFWNGRYYTEVQAATPLADAVPLLAAAAQAVAAGQLDYGSPFAEENLLPADERAPDSFRYVHRAALGLAPLNEAFLVDLSGGMTAWVIDAGTVSAAQTLLEAIKTSAESTAGPEAGYDFGGPGAGATTAVRYVGPLTVITLDDGDLAVFTAQRYVHGTYGRDADAVVTAARNAYARVVPASAGPAAAVGAAPAAPGDPFPNPGSPDWRTPVEVSGYTPDNLYVKIDGRADIYLQYQVVSLTFGSYYHSADRGRMIDVYWYDMGASENALGIYRAEAAPDGTPISIGSEGYQIGGAVFFRRGTAYVQVLPMSFDEADAEVALMIARRLAERIEDAGDDLWALNLLPQTDRLADSFAYIARDAFSLDFLTDVYTAKYEVDGERITLFIHRAADEASAAALLDRYRGFFADYGRVLDQGAAPERRMIAGDVAGLIDVVFVKGRYLGGATGADHLPSARKAATAFHDELTAP